MLTVPSDPSSFGSRVQTAGISAAAADVRPVSVRPSRIHGAQRHSRCWSRRTLQTSNRSEAMVLIVNWMTGSAGLSKMSD